MVMLGLVQEGISRPLFARQSYQQSLKSVKKGGLREADHSPPGLRIPRETHKTADSTSLAENDADRSSSFPPTRTFLLSSYHAHLAVNESRILYSICQPVNQSTSQSVNLSTCQLHGYSQNPHHGRYHRRGSDKIIGNMVAI